MADFDWNKYKKADAAPSQGFDWGKYQREEQAVPDEVLNERAPQISFKDRLVAKNLAQSLEKQADYLKVKYPGLDIKTQGSDVLIRPGKDQPYRKLDPSTFEGEDITDVIDSVVGGVTSTIGTIGGGLAGSFLGGAGAIPGAVAGSGAAGMATEAGRQKLGQMAGIPQEVSGSDVLSAGAANAAGTALLGTGKLVSDAALSGAKGELRQKIAERIAKGETQGLIRKFWNDGIPGLARYWTGVTDDVLKSYSDPIQREEIKALSKGGRTDFTENLVNQIKSGLNSEKRAVGEDLASSIDNAGYDVNTKELKALFQDHIRKLEAEYEALPNPINKGKVDDARATFGNLFANVKARVPTVVEEMQPVVDGHSLIDPNTMELIPRLAPVQKTVPAFEADKKISKLIPDEITPSSAFRLQQDMKDFGDLRRIGSGLNPRYASNATAAEKEAADTALSGYQILNNELDRVTEGASPELKQKYRELKDLQDALAPSLRSDQSAYSTFTNLDGKSKVAFKEALQKLGAKTGEDYAAPMTKLQAADYFGDKSWTPKSIGGTTSTSRTNIAKTVGGLIGGAVGAKTLGMYGAAAGAGVGAAAGGASASPRALQLGIENTDWIRALANQLGRGMDKPAVTPLLRETVVQSPWESLP